MLLPLHIFAQTVIPAGSRTDYKTPMVFTPRAQPSGGSGRITSEVNLDYFSNEFNVGGANAFFLPWMINSTLDVDCGPPIDSADHVTLKWAGVRFDSIFDVNTSDVYDINTLNSIKVDSIILWVAEHQNNSGLLDTIVIKILEVNPATVSTVTRGITLDAVVEGQFNNNVLWTDSIFANSGLTANLTTFTIPVDSSGINGITIPNTADGFIVTVEYFGPEIDTFNLADMNTFPCGTAGGNLVQQSAVPGSSLSYLNFIQTGGCTDLSGMDDLSAGTLPVGCRLFYRQNMGISAIVTVDEPDLTITTSNDTTACDNDPVQLFVNATGGSGSYSYLWTTGGAFFDSVATITVGDPGTFVVTVSDGFTSVTDSVVVTYSTSSPPCAAFSVTLPADQTLCQGSSYTIVPTVSGGTTPYTYLWSTGATTTTLNVTTSGSYSVTVSENGGGLDSDAINVTFTTASPPCGSVLNVVLPNDTTICDGDSYTVTPQVSGGTPPYFYEWTFPDFSTSNNTSISASQAGTYILATSDNGGGTDTSFFTLSTSTASPPCSGPALAVDLGGNQTICDGDVANINATVTGGTAPFSYAWNTGASDTLPFLSVSAAGIYSVTVTDAGAATATQSVTITTSTASPPCATPTPLSIDAGNDVAICQGDTATLTGTPSGGTGGYTYLWFETGDNTQTITVTDSGTYTVAVFDNTGGFAQDEVVVSFTTASPPCPTSPGPLAINLGNDTVICQLNQLQIDANATGGTGNYTYNWSNTSTFSSIFVQPTGTTTYSLTVNDGVNTVTDSITVTPTLQAPPCGSNYFINGIVLDDSGNPMPFGEVTLYDISNTVAGYDTLGTAVTDSFGAYSFAFGAPLFRSLTVLAKPDLGAYPSLLPTYLGDTDSWADALSYFSDTSNQPVPDITMQRLTPGGGNIATGNNVIRGTILTNIIAKRANPIEDEDIILSQNPPGSPVAYRKTTATGSFEVSGLGIATYEITADVAGIPMNTATNKVTFNTLNDTIDVTIIVDSTIINVDWDVSVPEQLVADEVKLYPNPSNGKFVVEFGRQIDLLELTVTDVAGKAVHTETAQHKAAVQLELNVEPGIYFVSLQTDSGERLVKRLVVQ